MDSKLGEQNMKCENCNDEATFEIKNIRKNEIMYFCDLHFWQFCKKMDEYYDMFKDSLPKIKEMLESYK